MADVSRVPDLRIFAGRATRRLAAAVARELGVRPGTLEVSKFGNDNTFVRVGENVREADVFYLQTSCPPVNENLMECLITLDALARASVRRLTAVLPYYPYARSDKKDQPRVPITARLVADLLVAAGADRVLTVDLHADQIQGFFTIPVDHLTAMPIVADHFLGRDLSDAVVVATDAGAAKRADRLARRLGVPLALMDKRRVNNGDAAVIAGFVGDVRDRHAIVYEDEIATAGTLAEAVEVLRQHRARAVSAACTHAVFAGPALARLAALGLEEIVVTDTVPVRGRRRLPNLRVLSVAPLLAEAIRRIHTGESISALFR